MGIVIVMARFSTTSFGAQHVAKGRFWFGAIALATAALACRPGERTGDDGARALQQRHVDAERLGVLMSATPTLNSAMTKIADPWTRVLTAAEAQALLDDMNYKTAAGVGLPELLSIDLDVRGYTVQIVNPLPGGPAERAGLKTGDTVVSIAGKPTEGKPWKDIMAALRVPEGQSVELEVRNRQEGLRRVQLKSEPLTPPALVEGQPAGESTAVIRLRGFTERTAQEVAALLESLQPTALELDLQNNPGGSVTAMLAVAGLFVGPQAVLGMRGAKGTEETLKAVGEQRFSGPLTVRVNEGSASAAEALALALRHAKRASIVGRKTFGKCLVHDIVPMSDGRSLLMTIGRMHAPGQRPWCAEGVKPDAS
jgi:carboxyl-terminal processing protease